ncbi:MAG TPA: M36 family metallopeptidase, partial [Roseiflexaceae bacterium]|nr:M36 family metallopeptidase [Roseiflexaceae bacterium]
LGEGWSDFYALSLLNNTNADDPDGEYAAGGYATYQLAKLTDNYLYGIRRFPYTTDNRINPLTWADADDTTANMSGGIKASPLGFEDNGGLEVHALGEIWALSLWEVRSRIIADPNGADGDVPTGNATMLQLTTDAMKLTPLNPSVVDARDALIDADCAANACANERSIWAGFADRGLGYGAVAPLGLVGPYGFAGHMGVGESFAPPYLDVQDVTIDDSAGNNNGAIEPGEPIALKVKLLNPWRAAAQKVVSATATLSSSTPGVTILDDTSSYGSIAAQASASGDPFQLIVNPSATCGQSLSFSLQTTSALGTTNATFTLRLGAAAGVGAPRTFTRTINGGLPIPTGDPLGVTNDLVIADDLEIADLDFRIDNLTHSWTGDLTVMLKGPNGYGTDLIYLRDTFRFTATSGDGDNFVNTVIDQQATANLEQAPASSAPFTGKWKPAFNSQLWTVPGLPTLAPDPIGQLSRFNGLSTKGAWRVHVTDQYQPDGGALNVWSLIVTPRAFTCVPFSPTPLLRGTKAVSGTLAEGSNAVYTVELSNLGSLAQPDAAGPEFTDVLPAGLALVSATADAGLVTSDLSANTVHWDGTLAAVGGTATITIVAKIIAGTAGTTIANQGTIAYDADANGSNEASALTDDPSTEPLNDATQFVVGLADNTVVYMPFIRHAAP